MNTIKNHIGLIIGDFIVIGEPFPRRGHMYYPCKCICGNIENKIIYNLKRVKYQKCFKCRQGVNSHAWKGVGLLPHDIFNNIWHSAIDRKLEFNITIEQIWELYLKQGKKCALTGWPITFNTTFRTKKERTASLDRIDSTEGYTIDNVQWVHRDINLLKKNYKNDEFINMCLAIANNLKEKSE